MTAERRSQARLRGHQVKHMSLGVARQLQTPERSHLDNHEILPGHVLETGLSMFPRVLHLQAEDLSKTQTHARYLLQKGCGEGTGW